MDIVSQDNCYYLILTHNDVIPMRIHLFLGFLEE